MEEEQLLKWIDNPRGRAGFYDAWELVNEEAKPRLTRMITQCIDEYAQVSWWRGLLIGLSTGIVATALFITFNPPPQRWSDFNVPFDKLSKYEKKARRALMDDILGP